MTGFTVSPGMLREKARLIRALLEESQSGHQQLWGRVSDEVAMLPRDVAATDISVNIPWNNALEVLYDNYRQIALNMGTAADSYKEGDHEVKDVFDYL